MSPQELKTKLEKLAPGTQAIIVDLTGTEDHYQATVTSPAFRGLATFKQHKLVMDFMKEELQSGEVHALTLKTKIPEALT